MPPSARERFLELLRTSARDGSWQKLTLGKYRGGDSTLQNLFVRPVTLKSGPHLAFVWRHATRDITKNHPTEKGLAEIERLLGSDFLDAHLFTASGVSQLELQPDGTGRLRTKQSAAVAASGASPSDRHDASKNYLISPAASWLRALGVTNDRGQPREGMADKFRQIQKFAELLSHLVSEAFPQEGQPGSPPSEASSSEGPVQVGRPLHVVDMGAGKGYLTFALAALLGERAEVLGIEARAELVALCNDVVRREGFGSRLRFAAGTIADTPLYGLDILVALHACDTATDDALARGIAAGARLLVVAPCCQKELRPQLRAPAVLADALRHGIFQERQAEFVTDALRAELLEWAGYRTKVFEFISTEHTAKNLMIAAVKTRAAGRPDDDGARRIRALAQFYGIRSQRLAQHLGLALTEIPPFVPVVTS